MAKETKKNGKKAEVDNGLDKKLSQEARLKSLTQRMYMIVGVSIIMLLAFIFLTTYSRSASAEQLETTMFLNQYRTGSKNLTTAVQSYAATGEEVYYDNYMKELNEDKNRDIAWAGLQANDIKEDEWAMLNNISGMSNGLVPLEEEAMAQVKKGNTAAAIEAVFGAEYKATAEKISSETDRAINTIQNRLARYQSILNILVTACEVIFVVCCILIIYMIVLTIGFARKELLNPIIGVSAALAELSQGNLNADLGDMKANNSEVGRMVGALAYMKENFSKMITEIADVLGSMGQGNYRVEVKENYVGEFVKIKEAMEDIIAETFRDVSLREKIYENKTGKPGISKDDTLWFRHLINCEIFKIGVLQFQPFEMIYLDEEFLGEPYMEFSKEQWISVLSSTVPPKTVAINTEAFEAGYRHK